MFTTKKVQAAPVFSTDGTSAIKGSFDISRISSLIENRNNVFHLDLSNSNLVQVFEAKEAFCKKQNPGYSLSPVISAIKRLESAIGSSVLPVDVTDEFYAAFQEFLLSVPGPSGKVCKPSTITTYFSTIQGCLNWASKHRCQISETYNCWSVSHYEKPKIALSPAMIAHLYYFDVENPTNKRRMLRMLHTTKFWRRGLSPDMIRRCIDQFVLECQLGQRYSDAHRFDESNFDETKTVYHCTQQKTGCKAVVNLSRYAIDRSIAFEILRKYDYKAPALHVDINVVNKVLHLVCRCIGGEFDKSVVGENKINGVIVSERYKVWQLITTHTARRTFITFWANNKEVSIIKLQKCTGHKDVRQLSRYTVVGDDE